MSDSGLPDGAAPAASRAEVHSLDSGPETGSKGSHTVVVVFIGIIFVVGLVMLVIGFQLKDAAQQCAQVESATCYTLTCPVNATPVNSCVTGEEAPANAGSYAYRCTSKTTLQCSWNPGVDVPVLASDGDICAAYTAS